MVKLPPFNTASITKAIVTQPQQKMANKYHRKRSYHLILECSDKL